MSSELYQIYWKETQLPNLFDFATPYFNEHLTPFFENDVIAKVVPKSTAEKIGVCSWALRQKIGGGIPIREPFSRETLEKPFEVLSLMRKMPDHDVFFGLDQWHPGSKEILFKIFDKLNRPRPGKPKDPIYQNHFVAKRQIYQDYVSELLIPAMYLMSHDEEIKPLVNVDSGYFKLKPPFGDFAERCKKYFGSYMTPLHAFLCERLFSLWIHGKPIKVTYI